VKAAGKRRHNAASHRYDPRRRSRPLGSALTRLTARESGEGDVAIGEKRGAAAVAAKQGRADAADRIGLGDPFRVDQIGHEIIPLRVDVRRGVVGDLAGVMADPDAVVEGSGSQPHRPSVVSGRERLPQADMVAGRGAPAGRLLEGEILPAAFEIERADRRAMIGPAEYDAVHNAQRRGQGHRIGRGPASRRHRAVDIRFRAFEADVDRVARNALGGEGSRAEGGQSFLMLVMAPSERRETVGEGDIGRQERRCGDDEAPVECC